ncbi:MAG TPA: DUF1761 domain-containing protein [Bacteroidia bacterium]|nr:DUF1761 domain-containing protein [Bacteroidia bacterium]
MDMSTINWMAVVAAAVLNFFLGGLWYSPVLFGKAWQKENQLSDETLKQGNMAGIFGFAFLWSFVMSFNLAMFLNDKDTDMSWGIAAGFLAGFGWVAAAIYIIGLFERRSTKYMLINSGYMIISFLLMGLIIGAWR